MTVWTPLVAQFRPSLLGLLPEILRAHDSRSVREQLEDRYAHGGGYRPMKGFKMNPKTLVMRFPGDDPFKPAATTMINHEKVVFYPYCSLLAIIQPNGDFSVTRVD
jgi:hypothetical protein